MSAAEDDDSVLEARHYHQVVASMRHYAVRTMPRVGKAEHDFSQLSDRFRRLLPHMETKFASIKQAIARNQDFLDTMLDDAEQMFPKFDAHPLVLERDLDKARSTLKVRSGDAQSTKYRSRLQTDCEEKSTIAPGVWVERE